MDVKQFINCFENEVDKKYIEKLVYRLEEIRVLNNSTTKKVFNNISILVTERCNLFCKHCAASSKKMEEDIDLTTEQMLGILEKVIACKPKSITISGGEPLVRKDFKELIQFIRSNSESSIDLMTNAILITDELAKFIADNVNVVDISIDGYDEKSCSLIRGNGVFDKVINNIKLLQKYGMDNIALSMVDIHKSPYEQKLFKNLCSELGVKPVIRILSASGRAMENLKYLEKETKRNDINKTEDIAEVPSKEDMENMLTACTCIAGNKCVTIQANGDIVPCDAFSCENIVIGNIQNLESLYDFIQSEEYEKSIGLATFSKFSPYGNVLCKECPVRYFCLSCPFQAYDYIKNRGSFEEYCKFRKPYFYEMIWEEEIE